MALLRPLAQIDQVLLEPLDGIAQRPMFVIVLGAVARRIVAGGMRGCAIGDQLDQRGPGAGARPLGRPLRHGIHRQEIVAVDADAGDAVTRTARREGALLAAGVALESGDRPLIVHDVQNDRRLVHRGEQQRVMKIGFGAAALADPTRRQMILALDRRRHRPANGLRKLSREIAGDGKNIAGLGVVHHRQLAALAHVAGVGQQLAHEIDQRNAARNLQPLIAIRRKQHVAGPQRHALRHRDRFFSQRADVKRDLAGALIALHAIIVQARQQHVPQSDLQFRRIEMRMPGAHRIAGIVEHAHQLHRQ